MPARDSADTTSNTAATVLNRMRATAARSQRLASTSTAQGTLIALMAPSFMMLLMNTTIGIALPSIRRDFGVQVDQVAWVLTIFTLPYVILMPLYGRLGDGLGRRRLLLAGLGIFVLGTVANMLSTGLGWLMVGRAVQGIGAAGLVPLSMAIISNRFPAGERGKALGTWNSIGPVTGMVGPLLGGLLIDRLGWQTIFLPVVVAGVIAVPAVWRGVPSYSGNAEPGFLRTFDWGGVVLLAVAVTNLLFYLTSEQITGVTSLWDWRLLATSLLCFALFVMWERRRSDPFVTLGIFAQNSFGKASVCAGARMFGMSGIGFLIPLYLADVLYLNAVSTGIILTIHAAALLITMRLGGQVADRLGGRRPVIAGMATQMVSMVYFTQLPGDIHLGWVIAGLVVHGLGAGLALAPLHRAALGQIPADQTGLAAGLYSMMRFAGSALGTALGGVLLQQGLDRGLPAVEAYHLVFGCLAAVVLAGTVLGVGLRE